MLAADKNNGGGHDQSQRQLHPGENQAKTSETPHRHTGTRPDKNQHVERPGPGTKKDRDPIGDGTGDENPEASRPEGQ